MTPDAVLLISLSNGEYLIKVALKIFSGLEWGDVVSAPLEPENKEKLYNLLPDHIKSFGKIVAVEEIHDLAVVHKPQ